MPYYMDGSCVHNRFILHRGRLQKQVQMCAFIPWMKYKN
jgi:hypothetical protein